MYFWRLYGTRNDPNSEEVKPGTVSTTSLNHGTGIFMNALRDNIGEVFSSPSWKEKAVVSEYYANCPCWTSVFCFGAQINTILLHMHRPIMCMPRQMWLIGVHCSMELCHMNWCQNIFDAYFCVLECLGALANSGKMGVNPRYQDNGSQRYGFQMLLCSS